MLNIKAMNINEAYLMMLLEIFRTDPKGNYENAYVTGIDSGSCGKDEKTGEQGQQRLQVDLLSVEIEHPEARPLQIVMPYVVGMPVVNDLDYIESYTNTKILSSVLGKNETYTYGSRIFEFPIIERVIGDEIFDDPGEIKYVNSIGTFNQFDWVVKHFKKSPQNNHCCIQIATGNDLELEHAPCLRLIDLKMVEGKLNMTLYFRSWDLYTGFPSNLAAFQILNEIIADEIGEGVDTGKLFGVSSGAHIYSESWKYARLPYEYYVLGKR
jgi:thymidylate synthase